MKGRALVALLLGLAVCLPGADQALAGRGGGRAKYDQARVREDARTAKREMSMQRSRNRGGRGRGRGRGGRRAGESDPFMRFRTEESRGGRGARGVEEGIVRGNERSARRGRAGEERRSRSELAARLAESEGSVVESRGRSEVRAPERLAIERAPERTAIERAPERLAIEQGPERKAIERAPERLAIERGPERKAIERAPERLAIERAPEPKVIERAPERLAIESGPQRKAIEETTSRPERIETDPASAGRREATGRRETTTPTERLARDTAARPRQVSRRARKANLREQVRTAAQDARDLIDAGEITEAARVIGSAPERERLGFRDRLTLKRARNDVLHAAYSMANRRSRAGDIEGTVDALQAVGELAATGELGTMPLVKAWFTEDIGFLDIHKRVFDNAMELSTHSRKYGDLETAAQQLDFAGQLRPGDRRITRNAKKLYKASLDYAGKLAEQGDAESTYLALAVAEHAAAPAGFSDYKVAVDLNKSLIKSAEKLRGARQHDEAAEMLARAEMIQGEADIHPGFFLRRTQRNLTRELGRRVTMARQRLAEELAQAEAEAQGQEGGAEPPVASAQ